jgi:hypothetical protein
MFTLKSPMLGSIWPIQNDITVQEYSFLFVIAINLGLTSPSDLNYYCGYQWPPKNDTLISKLK